MILLCENKAGLKLKAAIFSPKNVHIRLPQDFFDFIVIDECHRGGANDESEWRKLMEYFQPSYQLGLTATPRRTINGDTYKYFGEPVYQYSLKQGIEDGYLTTYRVKSCTNQIIDDYVYDDEWDNPNPVCPICGNLSCTCPKEIIAELGSMFGV